MKRACLFLALFMGFIQIQAEEVAEKLERRDKMKLKITVQNAVPGATIYDNHTARDFIKLLPLM